MRPKSLDIAIGAMVLPVGHGRASSLRLFIVHQSREMSSMPSLLAGRQKPLRANRGYVLQTDSIVLTDTAQNLLNNPMMKKAYLGGGVS